ncbi:MAG: hypothetical protein ACRDNH_00655 [Gaiellaceae bacterium]
MSNNGAKRFRGATCKARNRLGDRCNALAGSDGLCSAHRDPDRMRELGKKGGSIGKGGAARRKAIAENPNLRDFLRANVAPAEVWRAIQAALEGSSEAARVSASILLIDALHQPELEREQASQLRAAAEEFTRRLADRVERQRQIRLEGLRDDGEKDELDLELDRLRAIERQWLAIPESIRAEHAPAL